MLKGGAVLEGVGLIDYKLRTEEEGNSRTLESTGLLKDRHVLESLLETGQELVDKDCLSEEVGVFNTGLRKDTLFNKVVPELLNFQQRQVPPIRYVGLGQSLVLLDSLHLLDAVLLLFLYKPTQKHFLSFLVEVVVWILLVV